MKGIIYQVRVQDYATYCRHFKQLLPVYNKPMIMYPLATLLQADIRDILIIVAPDHAGDYLHLLGSGRQWGAKFTYEIQDKPADSPKLLLLVQNLWRR